LQPALPIIIFATSRLPTFPIVAQQNFSTKRISPDGRRNVIKFPSLARTCAKVPAERAI